MSVPPENNLIPSAQRMGIRSFGSIADRQGFDSLLLPRSSP